jgi:mono/diheme cytochrome c family protein
MENYKTVAMRASRKLFQILIPGFLLVFSQCAMRKSEPIQQKAFTPATEQVRRGEVLYMAHCQKCHPAGEAGLGPAINSNPAPQFIKRFQIRHGLGVMPAFRKGELSKSDLKAISKYMRAWKHY